MKKKVVLTPSEFAIEMQSIFENSDVEDSHYLADELMCKTLKSLGFGVGVKIFINATKWYA